MKFVIISDSHGQHRNLILPEGDIIIHAGDLSKHGDIEEVIEFLDWFKGLKFEYKVFIAGNHDFFFERSSDKDIQKLIPDNVIYLCDSGVTIEGIKLWGSPITPWFHNWAFNRHRGEPINRHWNLIPLDIDILITHGPALGKLDKIRNGQNVGCKDLLEKVNEIQPKVHVCGHIHEAYGQVMSTKTKFINASVVDENYNLKNEPIIIEL